MNLLELLYKQVEAHPERECIWHKQNEAYTAITYGQFWEQIQHAALGFAACGITSGMKVAILSTNCPEWAISDYAILALGAVVVPIYPTLPSEQIDYILKNAEVELLLAENETQAMKVTSIQPPPVKRIIQFKGNVTCLDGTLISFDDVLKIGSKRDRDGNAHPDIHSIQADELATIVHTSGTSGRPKGVMLTHANLVSNIEASLTYLPIEPTDKSLSYLPLSHIFERTVGQFAFLSSGGSIAYAESLDTLPKNLLEIEPTVLITVPRLLEKVYAKTVEKIEKTPSFLRRLIQSCLSSGSQAGIPYRLVDRLVFRKLRKGMGGRIRCVVSGGAGLQADIARFFNQAGIPVHEGYGMTEASPVICTNPFGENKPGTVGLPLPNLKVRLEPDGELCVFGPSIMQGYYRDQEETRKAFTEDGWLRTGDIARIDEQGYVQLYDRKKNLIVLATGKNVAPMPVENAIKLSPFLSEAILIGDAKQYVACLLFPDFESLASKAAEFGLEPNRELWVSNPRIQNLIRTEIEKYAAGFASFELPKRAVLLPDELTIDSGELTPTLKIRNQVIRAKYKTQIENMYQGKDFMPLFAKEDSDLPSDGLVPDLNEADVIKQTDQQTQGLPNRKRNLPMSAWWIYAILGVICGLLARIWIGGIFR